MTSLQRALLLPCLAPLLALLLVSAVTTRSGSRLRIVLWTSPEQSIGTWMAIAGLTGAGFSMLSALLLVPPSPPLRRRLHQAVETNDPSTEDEPRSSKRVTSMPERDIRDPAPTVAVPYRVIQRGDRTATRDETPSAHPTPSAGEPDDWDSDPDRNW